MHIGKAVCIQLAITMLVCFGLFLRFNFETASEIEKDQENAARFLVAEAATVPVQADEETTSEEPSIGFLPLIETLQNLTPETVKETSVDPTPTSEKNHASEVNEPPAETVLTLNMEALKAENGDAVGWIRQPNTDINYPVVQGSDNKYYLNHSFDKKQSDEGAIYIDYRCDLDGRNLVIYGHNTSSGKFDSLLGYLDGKSYWEENAYFIYYDEDHPQGIVYDIFAVIKADVSTTVNTKKVYRAVKEDSEYEEYLEYLKDASRYDTGVSVSPSQHMILLSTCCYNSNKRCVVCGIARNN